MKKRVIERFPPLLCRANRYAQVLAQSILANELPKRTGPQSHVATPVSLVRYTHTVLLAFLHIFRHSALILKPFLLLADSL
jgi:hypothetical protein